MNSEAVRQRNARKRAKLRAKKRGEVFAHVYLDAERVGCFVTCDDCSTDDWCETCTSWRCKEDPNLGQDKQPKITPRTTLSISYVFMESADISPFEEVLNDFASNCFSIAKGDKVRYTLAVTKEGQRRVKQWLVTTEEEEIGVADVIAAVSTLSLSLSRQTSSSLISS